jgi:hypothetical protein
MQVQQLLPEGDIKELRKPALRIRIHIQLAPWIRIRFRNADPDPASDCRFGSSYLNIGAKRQNLLRSAKFSEPIKYKW